MKKFVPIALLLCVFFSLSSFVPVKSSHTDVVKKAYSFSFPITGTVSGSYMGSAVTWYYYISGSGSTPYAISFSLTSGGAPVDSSPFYLSTGSTYYATDLDGTTGITAVEFVSGADYHITFYRF